MPERPSLPVPELTFLQARVLAVLVEKRLTVPDTYPLSLNALVSGCNQKSSRDPVTDASEHEVRDAVDGLRRMSLVIESSGSRTMRYAENVKRVYGIPNESVSLIATLILRGPQTAAELRLHSERMQRFSDGSAVEGFLHELAAHATGPLVRLLPRRPGERESRWMHLLVPAGVPAPGADGVEPAPVLDSREESGISPGDSSALLEQRIERLERDLAELRERFDRLVQAPAQGSEF